jgi:hypothetical protein
MKKLLLSVCAISTIITFQSCTKDADNNGTVSDASISQLAMHNDFVYTNSNNRIAANTESAFAVKMNKEAASVFNGDFSSLPPNSIIVKEKFTNGKISGYDVKYKAPSDPSSVNGWLWTSLDENGNTIDPVEIKGQKCQSCHGPSLDKSLQ